MVEARALRARGTGTRITYSPKVFVPLTTLCRDVCGYCTFARPPRRGERAYLREDEVLAIARAGAEAGCTRGALHARRPARGPLPRRTGGARRAGLRDDARVPRPLRATRARRDRSPAAPQRGGHVARGARRPEAGRRVDGDHARDDGRPARRARRPALGFARQGAGAPSRDDAARGRAVDPVHERSPDRDRRDARGAARRAPRPAGARRGARAPARGDRPELPGEAGDPDGGSPGRALRGAALVDRRRADRPRPGRARAGAAEPRLRRLPAPAGRGHRRLGRRLARDRRPRQSRGAVARGGAAPRGVSLAWPRARAAAPALPGARRRPRPLGRPGRRARDPPGGGRPRARPRGPLGPRGAGRRPVPRAPRRGSPRPRGRGAGGGGAGATLRRARPGARARPRVGRPAAARGLRRRRDVRRHAEHPVHERLLLPLRLLCVLEGEARGEPARARVPRARRRDRPSRPRGVGPRSDRGLPPGWDPSVLHGRLLRGGRPPDQGRGARDARPRILGARGLARGGDARPRPRHLSRAAARPRPRVAPRAPPRRSSTTRCVP